MRSASRPRGPREVLVLALCLGLSGCVCKRTSSSVAEGRAEAKLVKPASVRCPAALVAAREGGTDPDRYVPPSEADRTVVRDVIAALLAPTATRAVLESVSTKAAAIGLEIVEQPDVHAVLVREQPSRRRGGGAYLVRLGSTSKLALQAPHSFFDEGTLPLACELFERTQAASLFVNTAHRYKAAAQSEAGTFPADVAHAQDSLFQAATEGLVRARPKMTVVQLHGFAEREGGSAIVFSGGVKTSGDPELEALVKALAPVVPRTYGKVARFPDDESELGATTNVQGAIVRDAGGRFLHIELSSSLRRDLLSDPTLRARVLAALANALEGA